MEDESAPNSTLSDDESKCKQSGVQFHTEVEIKVTNCVLMCDIILKQVKLKL